MNNAHDRLILLSRPNGSGSDPLIVLPKHCIAGERLKFHLLFDTSEGTIAGGHVVDSQADQRESIWSVVQKIWIREHIPTISQRLLLGSKVIWDGHEYETSDVRHCTLEEVRPLIPGS